MNKNKIDLNSLNSGMSSVKLKGLLMDSIPCEKLNETLRKLLKDNPHIFENTGSITANALANHEYNRQLPYILLRESLNK